jgi:hypothetical protein
MDFDLINIASLITAVFLLLATIMMVRETRRMREAQTEPDLFVNLEPGNDDVTDIYIVIGNMGQGAAYNIKFEINPDYEYRRGKFLSKLSFIKNGISFLASNQTIKSYLIWVKANDSLSFDELAKPFYISIKYENNNGKTYERTYPIDLEPLRDIMGVSLPSIHKNIEKIEEHLKDISSSLKK